METIDAKVRKKDLPYRYFHQLNPDDAVLIFDFFIVFSRFEFALKRAGYFRGDDNNVIPDWDLFSNTFSNIYDNAASPDFQEACEYYTEHPPQKQVVQDGKIIWKKNEQGSGESELHWILRSIRIVRNNLFHGGKFPFDIVRDTNLLYYGLVILQECLKFDRNLERTFTFDPM
jgi:hypothetical protein